MRSPRAGDSGESPRRPAALLRPMRREDPALRARPCLLGLGSATPALTISQDELTDTFANLWRLRDTALQRWRRIAAGAGIERRSGVMPVEQIVHLSTRARMDAFETHAPPLAADAAGRALQAADLLPRDVTDLIVVSCTGFSAPGLDVTLVDRLGLAATVRRSMIGFMGCFGAITGLRAAAAACAAERGAAALVVCAELCSLHFRAEPDVQNQVASALFADGAAAAVIAGHGFLASHAPGRCGDLGRLTTGASLLIPEGRDWMTWRITDAGFAMTLTRDVPPALRERIGGFVDHVARPRPRSFIVHPGGAGILDAVEEALGLNGSRGIESSRQVLRHCGNMSSATVLFVLEEALRRGCGTPAMLLAFGPGLTIESIELLAR